MSATIEVTSITLFVTLCWNIDEVLFTSHHSVCRERYHSVLKNKALFTIRLELQPTATLMKTIPCAKLCSPSWSSAMVKPYTGWTWTGRTRDGWLLGWHLPSCLISISARNKSTGWTSAPESSTSHPWEACTDRWHYSYWLAECLGSIQSFHFNEVHVYSTVGLNLSIFPYFRSQSAKTHLLAMWKTLLRVIILWCGLC